MTLEEEIERELRALRKMDGRLSAWKMAEMPHLSRALRVENTSEIYQAFISLVNRIGDKYMRAALASMGYNSDETSVLARLEKHAETEFVDVRTVRRWSDRGIERLARVIVDSVPFTLRPTLAMAIIQVIPELFKVEFKVTKSQETKMRVPDYRVNGDAIALQLQRQEQTQPSNLVVWLGQTEFSFPAEVNEVHVQVGWVGAAAPLYSVNTHFQDQNIMLHSEQTVNGLDLWLEHVTNQWIENYR